MTTETGEQQARFLDAMEAAHGYRPTLWPDGSVANGRDADRFEGYQLALAQSAQQADADEDAYVIDRLAHLLAEISVIVNGPEPAGTKWSYHDLPAKVAALAAQQAVAVPEGFVLVPRNANGNMIHAAVRVWDSSSAPDPEQLQVASETWNAMLAAAPSAPSGGWRSIESAPRDGSGFLAFWDSNTRLDERSYGVVVFVNGEWTNPDNYGETYGDPSHWMPLPPPPGAPDEQQ